MQFETSEIAEVTGGEVFGRPATVEGVSIDSRALTPGQMFVPLVAERDGHDFIGSAIEAGATAYLTNGPVGAGTAIRVEDTVAAFSALGGRARSRLPDRVVGITGSVGKTSLKDLLAAVARKTWRTSASIGSFNNELGVPLTLTNAPDDTELVVVEMGARGLGHISRLCEVARPTVGIVTVVAGVHLETFGSVEGVARAKSELVRALPSSGTAVLNADDDLVVGMAPFTEATVVTFGRIRGEVRAENVEMGDDLRARFTLRSPWGTAAVHLGVAGEHQVTNALGAAAAALALGASPDSVAAGLGDAQLSAMRMDLATLSNGLRLLDDTYNASPTSMRAALLSLAGLPAVRRFAVLGTMAELGPGAAEAHLAIAAEAQALGIRVISVAEPRYGLADDDALGDSAEAVDRLQAMKLGSDDAVLVKGSRSAGLERVVAGLRAR